MPFDSAAGSAPLTLSVLNVPVHAVTMADSLALVERFMVEPRLHQIATVNPEFVMAARRDPAFLAVLQAADLCLPDGVGLLWASRWLRQPLRERVAGSDLVYEIAGLAAERGWRIYLLGGGPGVAEDAATLLTMLYPQLNVAGTYAGSPDTAENEAILRRVNRSGADILYVAFGAPRQDKWIARNRLALTHARIAMGVGGSLDFITGRANRAPIRVQRLGLEWLHRLIQEPWRWRRMLALPRFALRVLLSGRHAHSYRERDHGETGGVKRES
jgi:N-acetylglucosaminyldiphosphoundecaprenol N-acetyl-beta-D-mannosaminyltransferase